MFDTAAFTWKIRLLGLAAAVTLSQMPQQAPAEASVTSASRKQHVGAVRKMAVVDARQGRVHDEATELRTRKPRNAVTPKSQRGPSAGT